MNSNPQGASLPPLSGQFNVQQYNPSENKALLPYSRRDYFKIWTVEGEAILHYANRSVHIDRPAIIFSTPLVPYAFERISGPLAGYMCIFTQQFLQEGHHPESILHSPLFGVGANPVFFPDAHRMSLFHGLYEQMLAEIASEYAHKYDVLRNLMHLMVHKTMKMQPDLSTTTHHTAASRIASLFLELLERQFPIDSPDRVLSLRKPADYAHHLSVHVNHLNHAVREVTGKPTSHHITTRITGEARALLRNTDWSVADIAHCLGFDYPTYFNNFFKKNTGLTPLAVRK